MAVCVSNFSLSAIYVSYTEGNDYLYNLKYKLLTGNVRYTECND